ncbi:hypothetical protein GCM10022197_26910 [Microlunatus spumicola]|uniref:Barstar (barnase inhibitor) domain-containing protein n=1 Tax=Microlunatus spumicola TaxID=81499 RepID=A0ABP6XLU1_9ACTN
MAAFDVGDDLDQDLAYRLIRDSFVSLFWRRRVLQDALANLRGQDYEIVEIDASGRPSTLELLDRFSTALSFPAYFGRNLNALNDCLGDVAEGQYGSDLRRTGLVLVLHHFDDFVGDDPRDAQVVLDIVADQCRLGALIGHRMMCLVQTDDTRHDLAPVGRSRLAWNPAEWLWSQRGLA